MSVLLPTLFIGDASREEFREAAEWYNQRGARIASDWATATRFVEEGFAPAVIVVAQAWPGQFTEPEVERLRRAAPLARIVTLLGPWLEGEMRSGRPWPAAQRVYWHQWRRLCRQSTWSLPPTVSNDDRLVAETVAVKIAQPAGDHTIAICTHDRHAAESLVDALEQRGWTSRWVREIGLPRVSRFSAFVVDLPRGGETALNQLRRLRTAAGDRSIVVILGYPRLDEVMSLQAAGATAVLSKPLLVDDLLYELDGAIG